MVNVPPSLQKVWDDVSKDGKIDRADAQKLLKAAAPSLDKKGGEISIDAVDKELDGDKKSFLANFTNIKEGASVDVKNGTAKGTFDFVDPPANNPTTQTTEANIGYTPLTLPDGNTSKTTPAPTNNPTTAPAINPSTVATQSVETPQLITQTTTQSQSKDQQDLDKLKSLKVELPNTLKDPQLTAQMKVVDAKIKVLEDKIKASGQSTSPAVTEPTKPATDPVESPTANPSVDVAKDLDQINQLKALKVELPKTLKDPQLTAQIKIADDKIKALEEKSGKDFISESNNIGTEATAEQFAQDKEQLKKDYESLPDSIKTKPEVKQAYEVGLAKTYTGAKAALFKEINTLIDSATQESLKSGSLAPFTPAKAKIEVLLEKYKALENDPDYKKIKGILSGDISADDARKNSYNNVHKAIDTVTNVNTLIDKPSWNDTDKQQATDYQKQLPEGPFRTKLEDRIKGNPATSSTTPTTSPTETTKKAIDDVMGKGFLNSTNVEGTEAIFQAIAHKGQLDDMIKNMNSKDQTKLIKMLASSSDEYSLAIAKKVYDNMSKSANIDGDLDKKTLTKVKQINPKPLEQYSVNPETVYKGMKYSIFNEKEAALTMARNILDGSVSSSVLSKFNSYEMNALVKLVGKDGSPAEKEQLMGMISGSYAKGDSVNIENLSKDEKSKIIKNLLNSEHVDETKLDEMIKKSGKDVVLKLVNNEQLTDKQLVVLAKHTDGDQMSDDTNVSSKMLTAMIKTYDQNPQSGLTLSDINKFLDQVSHDRDKSDVMKKLIAQLGDGPDSEYAKFKALAPATMDKIWKMSR
ncbi:MAG: hypothetical protein H7263_14610 [Candidatus Sericytochromatia bacterium]|nr:hypothetical protein [Candidatus Sericytochromatia bacterium]